VLFDPNLTLPLSEKQTAAMQLEIRKRGEVKKNK